MNHFKKSPLIYLLLFFLPAKSYSCSCSGSMIDFPVSIETDKSNGSQKLGDLEDDIIFHGILISTDTITYFGELKLIYTYEVIENFGREIESSVEVLTNRSSDACGYFDEIGNQSIITAIAKNNMLFTYREDCIKNVSKKADPIKFDRWLKFLKIFKNGPDGKFLFYQPKLKIYGNVELEDEANQIAIVFRNKNGKLDGKFLVYDRQMKLIEKGHYKLGEKVGIWTYILGGISDDYSDYKSGYLKLKYKMGVLIKSTSKVKYYPISK